MASLYINYVKAIYNRRDKDAGLVKNDREGRIVLARGYKSRKRSGSTRAQLFGCTREGSYTSRLDG